MSERKRVLIGMSGGIDSTVAAILLQEQGYELVGATFRTFDGLFTVKGTKLRDNFFLMLDFSLLV